MWVLFSFQIELSCVTKLHNLGTIKAEGKGGQGGGGGYHHEFMHNNFAFHKSQNK